MYTPIQKKYGDGIHNLNISTTCVGIIDKKYRVYGNLNPQGRCEGPCRLVDYKGNVVEGDFTNGECKMAYVYYAYANFAIGEWIKGGLNG
jgi:hypothetical protein